VQLDAEVSPFELITPEHRSPYPVLGLEASPIPLYLITVLPYHWNDRAKRMTRNKTARVDINRHSRDCSVCAHPDREEIEREFSEWKPAEVIARERKISPAAFYRHIRAMGLLARRDRNIKAALASFIERGYRVGVTASSFIAAITAYSKINAEGEWIDKLEDVRATKNLSQLERMTRGELARYIEKNELPAWWNSAETK
jgi:hypothetical protein